MSVALESGLFASTCFGLHRLFGFAGQLWAAGGNANFRTFIARVLEKVISFVMGMEFQRIKVGTSRKFVMIT